MTVSTPEAVERLVGASAEEGKEEFYDLEAA